jgi:hypothetical protein
MSLSLEFISYELNATIPNKFRNIELDSHLCISSFQCLTMARRVDILCEMLRVVH